MSNVISQKKIIGLEEEFLGALEITIFVFMKYKTKSIIGLSIPNVRNTLAFEREHEKRYLISYHKEFLSFVHFTGVIGKNFF